MLKHLIGGCKNNIRLTIFTYKLNYENTETWNFQGIQNWSSTVKAHRIDKNGKVNSYPYDSMSLEQLYSTLIELFRVNKIDNIDLQLCYYPRQFKIRMIITNYINIISGDSFTYFDKNKRFSRETALLFSPNINEDKREFINQRLNRWQYELDSIDLKKNANPQNPDHPTNIIRDWDRTYPKGNTPLSIF